MNWTKSLLSVAKQSKCRFSGFQDGQNSALSIDKNLLAALHYRGCVMELEQAGCSTKHLQDTLISGRNSALGVKLRFGLSRNKFAQRKHAMLISCQYCQSTKNDPVLSRDFFARLWVEDRKRNSAMERKVQIEKALSRHAKSGSQTNGELSGASAIYEGYLAEMDPFLRQPPSSESLTRALKPSSVDEAKVAPLLARSHLLITRDIEWANLVWSLEQESRFLIVDVRYPRTPVGAIREQSNFFMRQLLRTRRPFVASICDGLGNELFKVRRPFWWITSSIFVEINGKEIGVVHRRWHLWRRIYDLYLGNKQFAEVQNPGLWNWTFKLEDIDGALLAEINRNWRGVGFEIFTDAGQYVIRFGPAESTAIPLPGIEDLEVKRPLTLSERAVAVALAVSLDCDYFSRQGGLMLPFLVATE